MKIHVLDMGRTKYGDSILIIEGDFKMLVDGGHPGDTASIRRQLSKILKASPPFEFDLLVVTHCHLDHIGCLPELIKLGDVTGRIALVADEKLGWGVVDGDGADALPANSLSDAQKNLFLALQEEDRSSLDDEELEQFLFDAARLEDTYKDMLQRLTDSGVDIVRYGSHSREDLLRVVEAGRSVKLKILGPSDEHLQLCANAIAGTLGDNRADLLDIIAADAMPETLIETYRNLAGRFERDTVSNRFSSDRPGIGAAKNNQSIVFSVEAPENDGNWKALLAGDMQFAKAEVRDLNDFMQGLLEEVNRNGPYDLIKLTHHASYNGTNDEILGEWNNHTKLFVHTGGWNDPTHPDEGVLRILEERTGSLLFARTDRNGLITIGRDDQGELGIDVSKGDFNDFTPNIAPDESPAPAPMTPAIIPQDIQPVEIGTKESDYIEITAKIPHAQTKVTITVDVEPAKKKILDGATAINTLPADNTDGRFTGLLAITSWKNLESNIQMQGIDVVKKLIASLGMEVIDLPVAALHSAEQAAVAVRGAIKGRPCKGILIIGGYDVVPAQKLDVIPQDLRNELRTKRRIQSDADDFIIWSDDIYGDVNGEGNPELPVTRIPDGKDVRLLHKALAAPRFSARSRFGVRNIARPFAQHVYADIPGQLNDIEISESFCPQDVQPDAAQGAVYYMLHGSERNGTRFWGETSDGEDEFEAFSIENVPASASGSVIFTGCCWGGLSAEPIAFKKTSVAPIRPRRVDQSIALKYLQAGALAFVGCTGSHYSPRTSPYNYHGKPIHDHFWKGIKAGVSPARALFDAKQQFVKDFPHGQTTPFSVAIEYKTFRQFTCLGLGW